MITHRYTSKEGVIVGKNGTYSGSIFKIPKYGELKIGRDPVQCDIIISSDCVNISHLHCSISYDLIADEFFVKDTSTNGTVVEYSGGRTMILGQTMRVRSGSVIYLGDNKNSFMLL